MWYPPALTETKGIVGGVGVGVDVAVGVFVGAGVGVSVGAGVGVGVGTGVRVAVGVFVGTGVLVAVGVGVGVGVFVGAGVGSGVVPDAGGVACPSPSLPQQATEPSLLTPQVWEPGADGDEGTRGRRGPAVPVPPQQATEPSLLTPQVWTHPALTETKEPAGGVAWPSQLPPQQATEPSLLTPQVYYPALTETKEPAGGVAWPAHRRPSRRRSRRSSPRRCVRPGADGDEGTHGRRGLAVPIPAPAGDGAVAPHPAGVAPPDPALTETKEPAGGVAWPSVCCPSRRRSRCSSTRRCANPRR